MRIGILQCGHTRPETFAAYGDFPAMFARLLDGHGFTFTAYDVENMVFPDAIDTCDGWLLTGSRHGAYEKHPFIPPLEDFIRDAYAAHRPLVGICFGHQIIAQALGGHVEKFDRGWAIGLTEYAFDALGTLKLNAWHQDQVIRRPVDAKPIARNGFCENAALVYGDTALTIQPHPEFGGALVSHYADLLRGVADIPDALLDRAQAQAGIPDNNEKIAEFYLQNREVSHA